MSPQRTSVSAATLGTFVVARGLKRLTESGRAVTLQDTAALLAAGLFVVKLAVILDELSRTKGEYGH